MGAILNQTSINCNTISLSIDLGTYYGFCGNRMKTMMILSSESFDSDDNDGTPLLLFVCVPVRALLHCALTVDNTRNEKLKKHLLIF